MTAPTDPHRIADRIADGVMVGMIIEAVTGCDTDAQIRIATEIDAHYDIQPPQDVRLFAHPATRRRHAVALLGVARIIQEHTGASDRLTLLALAELADQYTFTPRHQEEAA